MSNKTKPSKIMLDELYESADANFLKCLSQFQDYDLLLHFTNRWVADPRPWARDQLVHYIDGVWDSPGHEVIVKRIFKHAEKVDDVELLTHFLVALDRIVRRSRVQSWSYNWRTRQSSTLERLYAKPNRTVREQRDRSKTNTVGRRSYTVRLPDLINRPGNRLFTQKTRAYLRRRVWRTFRYLSYRHPDAYVAAVCGALELYRDHDFVTGESILDNWSLMHVAYFDSSLISFTSMHCSLVSGQTLTELRAAPYQESAWKSEESASRLWQLLTAAKSVLVRRWTIEMLQTHHARFCESVALEELLDLLAHHDAAIQAFAVERFNKHRDLSKIGIDVWLELVDRADVSVLATVCDALRRNVTSERMTNRQLIDLACARRFPAAELGFALLKQRSPRQPLSSAELCGLADVACDRLATEICDWALAELSTHAGSTSTGYETIDVIPFFDSLSLPVRAAACRWLLATGSPGAKDAALWAQLSESPADDVRFTLVDLLRPMADRFLSSSPRSRPAKRTRGDRDDSITDLARVWSAVILCVERGNRSKPKAIRQLATSIEERPDLAETFLPTLAVAARSIRVPEQTAALSAIAWLGDQSEGLREIVDSLIPEWQWVS